MYTHASCKISPSNVVLSGGRIRSSPRPPTRVKSPQGSYGIANARRKNNTLRSTVTFVRGVDPSDCTRLSILTFSLVRWRRYSHILPCTNTLRSTQLVCTRHNDNEPVVVKIRPSSNDTFNVYECVRPWETHGRKVCWFTVQLHQNTLAIIVFQISFKCAKIPTLNDRVIFCKFQTKYEKKTCPFPALNHGPSDRELCTLLTEQLSRTFVLAN